jgi:hypothetical protein
MPGLVRYDQDEMISGPVYAAATPLTKGSRHTRVGEGVF